MSVISIQTKKMGDLQTVAEVAKTDLLIVHDGSGMKTVSMDDLVGKDMDVLTAKVTGVESDIAPLIYNGIAHNSIYRGKYLGASVTAEQYAAISAGTFEDLYIGDYWTMGGINYRIAAFDYYWNCGDRGDTLPPHHAVIVPDACLYSASMNDTDTTVGGYAVAKMRTSYIGSAKTTVLAAFSGHVLNHRIYLVNAISNGISAGGVWGDGEVDIMNEQMVYGGSIFSPAVINNSYPANQRVEKSQLPLFAMNPAMVNIRENYWLRDVISDGHFARVEASGNASYYNASASHGVRPSFCIS